MKTEIIAKLVETLDARTVAALAAMGALDAEVAAAFADAERAAQAKLDDAVQSFDLRVRERVEAFDATLANMVAMARDAALQCLQRRVDAMQPAATIEPQHVPERAAAQVVERSDDVASEPLTVPVVTDPTDLHGKRGKQYVPVVEPRSGETYYRRDGRRWTPVRYEVTTATEVS